MIKKIFIDGVEVDMTLTPLVHALSKGLHTIKYYTDGIIPQKAFTGISNIKNVKLNLIKTISSLAYAGSSVESLTVPETVTSIESKAFDKSKLNKLVFEGNTQVNDLDSSVNVYVPDNLELSYKEMLPENNIIKNSEAIIKIKMIDPSKLSLISGVKEIQDISENEFMLTLNFSEIPNSWMHNANYTITEISFLQGVRSLGRFAFQNTQGLLKIDLGCVEELEYASISACHSLINITGGEHLTKVDSNALFSLDNITEPLYIGSFLAYIPQSYAEPIEVPLNITHVPAWTYNCQCPSITLHPNVVEFYGAYYTDMIVNFNGCQLTSIQSLTLHQGDQIPASLEYISDLCVGKDLGIQNSSYQWFEENSQLKEVSNYNYLYTQGTEIHNGKVLLSVPNVNGSYIVPEGIECIANGVFNFGWNETEPGYADSRTTMKGHITEIVLPQSLKTLHSSFIGCPITRLTIPDSCKSFTGSLAYSEITELNLGEGIDSLIAQSLNSCLQLETVRIRNTNKVVETSNYYGSAFYRWGNHKITNLYVPNNLLQEYQRSEWARYSTNIIGV